MQNISRITAEMSRSPASINSINFMCCHDNKAWRLLLGHTDFFFPSILVFFLSQYLYLEVEGIKFTHDTIPGESLELPHRFIYPPHAVLSKWDDWHDRWKIRRISDLPFILDVAAVCGSNCVYGCLGWGECCCHVTSVLLTDEGHG